MSTTLEGISYEIKELPNCRRAIYVKVAPELVTPVREKVSASYTSVARIPGYRPGKAPKAMVIKRFKKQIDEELQRKLVSDTVEDIIKGEGLRVMIFGDVEDIEFLPDDSFNYKVVLVVRPQFDLPEYEGIEIKQLPEGVTEQDVEDALKNVRERLAEFKELPEDATLEVGNYAVLQYKGTIEGEPVSEKLGESRLTYWDSNDQFWLEIGSKYERDFFPGITDKVVGMKKGESREITVTYPEDFQEELLRGATVDYNITLKEMTSRVLPEIDDALATKMLGEGKTLADLKSQVETDLGESKKQRNQRLARTQVARELASRVEFEIPEHQIAHETKRIAEHMVQEQLQRGVSEDLLEENQSAIVAAASRLALSNVKERYLLVRVADKEGIKVTHDEIVEYIEAIAPQYRMTGEQLHKQVHKSGAEARIEEDLLIGKALELLIDKANVTIDENAEQQLQPMDIEEHEHVHGPECEHGCDHDHAHDDMEVVSAEETESGSTARA